MNKPLLKVGPLTNLQDARSSAAVGFDMVTFSLERGANRKLSGSMIWSIIQWLSGPEVVLEINRFSIDELKEIEGVFNYDYLSLPLHEWGEDLLELPGKFILQTHTKEKLETIEEILAVTDPDRLFIELSFEKQADLAIYQSILGRSFLHQKLKEEQPINLPADLSVYAFSMKEEMEEEPGLLDYETIDSWIEAFQENFESV